jgi:tRNA 2-thiouridine synthesizing protein A
MSDDVTLLDATGLRCPLPVLRARKVLKSVPEGELLDVLATDTAAPADFEAFCRETGHTFVTVEQTDDVYRIRLRKAASGR